MSLNVTIGLNAETLAALNALTAAVIGVSNVAPAAAQAATVVEPEAKETAKAVAKPAAKAAAKTTTKAAAKEEAVEETEEVEPVTIYWFSSATDEVGIVESEEEYKALKKADAKTVKITEAKHKAHLAKQAAADEEAEEAEETAEEAAFAESDEHDVPTEQDVIDIFGSYLPTTLTDQEKAERRPFVKAILDRFGAKRATALKEGDRRLAINLVERKMAGDDVDPAEDEFEAIDGLV